MAKQTWVAALLSAPVALIGACHSDTDLPSDPPKSLIKVTSGGFVSPGDAVASPDGRDFFFTGYTDDADRLPSIFKTSSQPGSTAAALASGDPLEAPIGLVMACDGSQLYVADMGSEVGAVFSLSTGGGALARMALEGRAVHILLLADGETSRTEGSNRLAARNAAESAFHGFIELEVVRQGDAPKDGRATA